MTEQFKDKVDSNGFPLECIMRERSDSHLRCPACQIDNLQALTYIFQRHFATYPVYFLFLDGHKRKRGILNGKKTDLSRAGTEDQ